MGCNIINILQNIIKKINDKIKRHIFKINEKCEKKYYTDVCVICIINEPNKLYIPCGHVCICNECNKYNKYNYEKIINCPICKSGKINY